MQNVQKWAEHHSPILAATAIQYVSLVDPLTEIFLQLKKRSIPGHRFKTPNFSIWSELYQSDTRPIEIMLSFFNSISGSIETIQNISLNNSARTVTINANHSISPAVYSQDYFDELHKSMLTVTISSIEKNRLNISPAYADKAIEHILANETEINFFVQVWFPCIAIYQTLPRILYNNALNGDLKAFEKLLRLDRLLLHDTLLASKLDNIYSKSVTKYEKLIKDSLGMPKPRINRKRVLQTTAGLISAFAIEMGEKLEEPQIRDLFDKYSQDMHGIDDKDIPLASESFYQEIRRSRKNWIDFFVSIHPDKNI